MDDAVLRHVLLKYILVFLKKTAYEHHDDVNSLFELCITTENIYPRDISKKDVYKHRLSRFTNFVTMFHRVAIETSLDILVYGKYTFAIDFKES